MRPLECGGKRQRDTAFGLLPRCGAPARRPSESGVALTLPAALQKAVRRKTRFFPDIVRSARTNEAARGRSVARVKFNRQAEQLVVAGLHL